MSISQKFLKIFCSAFLALFLASCGSAQVHAPVYSNNQIKGYSSNSHIVRFSDTLYSIAWQRGVDVRDLAKWNGIASPYIIYKGQTLTLLAKITTLKRPKVQLNNHKKATNKQLVRAQTSSKSLNVLKLNWQWPIQVRKLVKGAVQSGVVLLGKPGELVRSSEKGKVVYAGNGLKGYGNLLIIMHSGEFLTAYGYNKRLLVDEGSFVKKGQAIAEIGTDNKKRRTLFFEMRRHGKTISVVKHMPKFRG